MALNPEIFHTDWPWPLKLIPRFLTFLPIRTEPVQIVGNVPPGEHLDVPSAGHWCIAGLGKVPVPVFFAVHAKSGRYLRVALLRYDYNARGYQVFSFAYRQYSVVK